MKSLMRTLALSTALIISAPAAQADELEGLKKQFSNYYEIGDFKNIFKTGHTIEAIAKAKLGDGHVRHIKALDRLANSYKIIGMKKKAEELLMVALAAAEAKHGKESRPALETRASLGFLFAGQNRLEDAKKQFVAAIAISEKINGADHLETRVMRNNLSRVQ